MPSPTQVHRDKKKEENKRKCRKPDRWEKAFDEWNKLIRAE